MSKYDWIIIGSYIVGIVAGLIMRAPWMCILFALMLGMHMGDRRARGELTPTGGNSPASGVEQEKGEGE